MCQYPQENIAGRDVFSTQRCGLTLCKLNMWATVLLLIITALCLALIIVIAYSLLHVVLVVKVLFVAVIIRPPVFPFLPILPLGGHLVSKAVRADSHLFGT